MVYELYIAQLIKNATAKRDESKNWLDLEKNENIES
jgi:hypothetical protein